MLRITTGQTLDHLRMAKGYQLFGIQVGRNDKPLQFSNAYDLIGDSIVYFYANRINPANKTIEVFELNTDCLIYGDGQYYVDGSKSFTGNLPDGVYYFEFSNGTTIFNSEMFAISEQSFDNLAPILEVKHFQDSPIFEFND